METKLCVFLFDRRKIKRHRFDVLTKSRRCHKSQRIEFFAGVWRVINVRLRIEDDGPTVWIGDGPQAVFPSGQSIAINGHVTTKLNSRRVVRARILIRALRVVFPSLLPATYVGTVRR